jgi:hypothetical protein
MSLFAPFRTPGEAHAIDELREENERLKAELEALKAKG